MQRRLGMMAVLGLLLLTSCGGPSELPTKEVYGLSGRITFAGSTTLQPLAHELGQAFTGTHPDVALEIAAGGSVVGIEAVHEGTVDIGMASRALKPEEAEGITQHQVAVDVIAVVVNASNSVRGLSLEQLRGIYLGEITDWSEVGGPAKPIVVVMRGENSGTRGAFDSIALNKEQPAAPVLQTAVTAGDMAALVGGNADAIGYVGFGNVEPAIKVLAIDGVMPSEETAVDGSYPLVRPLLFLTGPLTQPLAQSFIDFALGDEGRQIVRDSGWVTAQ